ncbi:MAG: NYN domain-containing protein [Terriglobia bacterium]
MPAEPPEKRAVVFVDGQNLYHSVRESFGFSYPNYDISLLASAVCSAHNWRLEQVRFYTGVPDATDDPRWNGFWTAKLAQMGRKNVYTFSRRLRYRNQTIRLPDGATHTFLAGEEKGIDVRIALDVIALAHRRKYDVAVIFSQDQDLSEVAEEVRAIAQEQNRWIKVGSAFPFSPTTRNRRGIDKTDWIKIDRATYDACLDRRDYRPKSASITGGKP